MTDVRNQPSRFSAWRLFVLPRFTHFELARVVVRFNHVARIIENPNYSIM